MDINNLPVCNEVESNTFSFEINELDYKEFLSGNNVLEEAESNTLEVKHGDDPAVDADDILKNGILVETNKGVVCMSLKDVLNSNLNLSVEDFKEVAAQLLSQSHEDIPTSSDENADTYAGIEFAAHFNSDQYTSELSEVTPQSSDVEMKLDVTELSLVTIKEEPSNQLDISQNNENTFALSNTLPQIIPKSILENADTSEETDKEKIPLINIAKRRGGWPKGRKRKPELLNLPPKAPKTSYNIFLNERRKLYKDKLAFHEITRVVGNQWSNLTTEEKRPYVERAEEDKKRYREELRIYRQSDAYKLYLARKRKKRALDNLMSESDMDGTDDIDDEDNDMLYCDTCDQWFYNLHNKREHLQSRQHKMSVVGDMTKNLACRDNECKGNTSFVSFSTSWDESSMDATPIETDSSVYSKKDFSKTESVCDRMTQLIESVSKREKEIKVLKSRLQESIAKQNSNLSELNLLKEKCSSLRSGLKNLKEEENSLEQQLIRLWNVPSLFVINNVEFVNNV